MMSSSIVFFGVCWLGAIGCGFPGFAGTLVAGKAADADKEREANAEKKDKPRERRESLEFKIKRLLKFFLIEMFLFISFNEIFLR